jgi:hypothetical protein
VKLSGALSRQQHRFYMMKLSVIIPAYNASLGFIPASRFVRLSPGDCRRVKLLRSFVLERFPVAGPY